MYLKSLCFFEFNEPIEQTIFFFMLFFLFFFKKCFSGKSISITTKNIDEITNNPNDLPVFIKFWSPYCPHCNAFQPRWNEFSSISNDNCIIADVNCVAQPKICSMYKIEGFPTLKWIHPSQNIEIEYKNDRSIEDLQSFVKIQLCSPFIPTKDVSEISKQKSQTNLYVFEHKKENDEIFNNVYEISKKYNTMKTPVFSILSSSDRLVFYEFDSSENFDDKKFRKDNLAHFFHKHIFSYFNEMKPEYVSKFHMLEKPVILYFIFNLKTTKSVLRFNLNSLKSKYYFLFSYYNQTDSSIRDLFVPYSKTEPFLVYIDPKTKKYISTKAHLTEESLLSWIKNEVTDNKDDKKWKQIFPSKYTIDKDDDILLFNGKNKLENDRIQLLAFNVFLYFISFVLIGILFMLLYTNKCRIERSPGQPIVDV